SRLFGRRAARCSDGHSPSGWEQNALGSKRATCCSIPDDPSSTLHRRWKRTRARQEFAKRSPSSSKTESTLRNQFLLATGAPTANFDFFISDASIPRKASTISLKPWRVCRTNPCRCEYVAAVLPTMLLTLRRYATNWDSKPLSPSLEPFRVRQKLRNSLVLTYASFLPTPRTSVW